MSVRGARTWFAGVLHHAGFTGDADAVLLMASELVTNAVRHAATPFEASIAVDRDQVRVVVIDQDSQHLPVLRAPAPTDTGGRGLLIVDKLADAWGSYAVGAGRKAVWFSVGRG